MLVMHTIMNKVLTSHLAVLIRPFIDIDVDTTLKLAPLNDYWTSKKRRDFVNM